MQENKADTDDTGHSEMDKPDVLTGKSVSPEERIDKFRKLMFKITCIRDDIQRDIEAHPFMPLAKRKDLRRLIDAYDDKIRKLKLDISTAQMLAKIPQNSDNIIIRGHFQDHPRKNK